MNMLNSVDFEKRFAQWVYDYILGLGVEESNALIAKALILLAVLLVLVWLVALVSRKVILSSIRAYSKKVDKPLLDELVTHQTFKYLTRLIPMVVAYISLPVVLQGFEKYMNPIENLIGVFMIYTVYQFLQAMLKFFKGLLLKNEAFKDKPIAAYVQLGSIVVTALAVLLAISVLADKSILSLLTALGAMSAVLLLVFKDTLSGLASSIRISTYDMLRNGDWIEFSKYGADGTVIDINLSSVKVRNFDHTFTTVPTSAFTADAFKNWRGMEESEGRRIMRSINISMGSIGFCSEAMIERFRNHPLLKEYIQQKESEIADHNKKVESTGKGVNRHLTNIGLFRAYLRNYLKDREDIHSNLTLLVRQLAPTEKGVPIQIYCFSKVKAWVDYEGIQSDIFDHVFASIKDFELDIFENPSDALYKKLLLNNADD